MPSASSAFQSLRAPRRSACARQVCHLFLLLNLLALPAASAELTLTHSSPAQVGPRGGGVLLLHGTLLPYRDALLSRAFVLVGSERCPTLPHRSDPRGSFLACGPIPHSNLTGAQSVSLMVGDRVTSCARCHLTFVPALLANASLRLSHRRGAAGDVITLVGVGSWPHLRASHGLHEQVSATIGARDALPRHPGSTAVHLVATRREDHDVGSPTRARDEEDGSGSWIVELAVPDVCAGEHTLSVAVDRLWPDESGVHGTVAIDGEAQASVLVLPALHEVQLLDERRVRLRGTGFTLESTHASVLVGSSPCLVLNTSLTEIVCEMAISEMAISEMAHGLPTARGLPAFDRLDRLGTPAAPGTRGQELTTHGAPSAGSGLVLREVPLRANAPECIHSLRAARDAERCAAAGEAAVALRQQLVFPHHTLERHAEESGGSHLYDRHGDHPHVLLTTDGWVRPPTSGVYLLEGELGDGGGELLCAMHVDAPPAASGATEHFTEHGAQAGGRAGPCSSGAMAMVYGQRYRFRLEAVLSGQQQLVVRALVVPDEKLASPRTAGRTTQPRQFRFRAAPAEWFEQGADRAPANRPLVPFVSLHIHGLSALCRMPGGCTYAEARRRMADAHREASDAPRLGWTMEFDSTVPMRAKTIAPPPETPPPTMLPLLPLLQGGADGRRRRLQSVCGVQSCCVVLYRGPVGTHCDAVPVWDFSSWTHPGGGFVSTASHRLCNSVRYDWLGRSGQHVLNADPEDASLTSLTGGAVKVGDFVDPLCVASATSRVANLTLVEQRWSILSTQIPSGGTVDVVVPRGGIWGLDTNLTARTLTVRGTLRWDTSIDGLELSVGYLLVERGGTFELGTYDAPMLLRATVRIRDDASLPPHPYLGSRFIAIDGLATSALDSTLMDNTASSSQQMERIDVTLSADVEPGQTIQIMHGGQVSGAHRLVTTPTQPNSYRPSCPCHLVMNHLLCAARVGATSTDLRCESVVAVGRCASPTGCGGGRELLDARAEGARTRGCATDPAECSARPVGPASVGLRCPPASDGDPWAAS
jgi:hypothetical protein